jgi:hypothetical protein
MISFRVNGVEYQLKWYMKKSRVLKILGNVDVEEIEHDYYVFKGSVFFMEYSTMIGLHFEEDKLSMMELYEEKEYLKTEEFMSEFERRRGILYEEYGIPWDKSTTIIHFDDVEEGMVLERWSWIGKDYIIEHSVEDRFGPAEHILIKPRLFGTRWKDTSVKSKLGLIGLFVLFIVVVILGVIIGMNLVK